MDPLVFSCAAWPRDRLRVYPTGLGQRLCVVAETDRAQTSSVLSREDVKELRDYLTAFLGEDRR